MFHVYFSKLVFFFLFFLAYCKRSEELLTEIAKMAMDCRELMVQFRTKLANEEMLSHNVVGKR